MQTRWPAVPAQVDDPPVIIHFDDDDHDHPPQRVGMAARTAYARNLASQASPPATSGVDPSGSASPSLVALAGSNTAPSGLVQEMEAIRARIQRLEKEKLAIAAQQRPPVKKVASKPTLGGKLATKNVSNLAPQHKTSALSAQKAPADRLHNVEQEAVELLASIMGEDTGTNGALPRGTAARTAADPSKPTKQTAALNPQTSQLPQLQTPAVLRPASRSSPTTASRRASAAATTQAVQRTRSKQLLQVGQLQAAQPAASTQVPSSSQGIARKLAPGAAGRVIQTTAAVVASVQRQPSPALRPKSATAPAPAAMLAAAAALQGVTRKATAKPPTPANRLPSAGDSSADMAKEKQSQASEGTAQVPQSKQRIVSAGRKPQVAATMLSSMQGANPGCAPASATAAALPGRQAAEFEVITKLSGTPAAVLPPIADSQHQQASEQQPLPQQQQPQQPQQPQQQTSQSQSPGTAAPMLGHSTSLAQMSAALPAVLPLLPPPQQAHLVRLLGQLQCCHIREQLLQQEVNTLHSTWQGACTELQGLLSQHMQTSAARDTSVQLAGSGPTLLPANVRLDASGVANSTWFLSGPSRPLSGLHTIGSSNQPPLPTLGSSSNGHTATAIPVGAANRSQEFQQKEQQYRQQIAAMAGSGVAPETDQQPPLLALPAGEQPKQATGVGRKRPSIGPPDSAAVNKRPRAAGDDADNQAVEALGRTAASTQENPCSTEAQPQLVAASKARQLHSMDGGSPKPSPAKVQRDARVEAAAGPSREKLNELWSGAGKGTSVGTTKQPSAHSNSPPRTITRKRSLSPARSPHSPLSRRSGRSPSPHKRRARSRSPRSPLQRGRSPRSAVQHQEPAHHGLSPLAKSSARDQDRSVDWSRFERKSGSRQCGGVSICPHGKNRSVCKECAGVSTGQQQRSAKDASTQKESRKEPASAMVSAPKENLNATQSATVPTPAAKQHHVASSAGNGTQSTPTAPVRSVGGWRDLLTHTFTPLASTQVAEPQPTTGQAPAASEMAVLDTLATSTSTAPSSKTAAAAVRAPAMASGTLPVRSSLAAAVPMVTPSVPSAAGPVPGAAADAAPNAAVVPPASQLASGPSISGASPDAQQTTAVVGMLVLAASADPQHAGKATTPTQDAAQLPIATQAGACLPEQTTGFADKQQLHSQLPQANSKSYTLQQPHLRHVYAGPAPAPAVPLHSTATVPSVPVASADNTTAQQVLAPQTAAETRTGIPTSSALSSGPESTVVSHAGSHTVVAASTLGASAIGYTSPQTATGPNASQPGPLLTVQPASAAQAEHRDGGSSAAVSGMHEEPSAPAHVPSADAQATPPVGTTAEPGQPHDGAGGNGNGSSDMHPQQKLFKLQQQFAEQFTWPHGAPPAAQQRTQMEADGPGMATLPTVASDALSVGLTDSSASHQLQPAVMLSTRIRELVDILKHPRCPLILLPSMVAMNSSSSQSYTGRDLALPSLRPAPQQQQIAASISLVQQPVYKSRYESPLLCFRSYRLSPHSQQVTGASPVSTTFSHAVDPMWPLCKFDARGKCNDVACASQHWCDLHLSSSESLEEATQLLKRACVPSPELLVSKLASKAAASASSSWPSPTSWCAGFSDGEGLVHKGVLQASQSWNSNPSGFLFKKQPRKAKEAEKQVTKDMPVPKYSPVLGFRLASGEAGGAVSSTHPAQLLRCGGHPVGLSVMQEPEAAPWWQQPLGWVQPLSGLDYVSLKPVPTKPRSQQQGSIQEQQHQQQQPTRDAFRYFNVEGATIPRQQKLDTTSVAAAAPTGLTTPAAIDSKYAGRKAAEGLDPEFWLQYALEHLERNKPGGFALTAAVGQGTAAGHRQVQQEQQQQQHVSAPAAANATPAAAPTASTSVANASVPVSTTAAEPHTNTPLGGVSDSIERALKVLAEGFKHFPDSPKLWLLLFAIVARRSGFNSAHMPMLQQRLQTYQAHCYQLWLLMISMQPKWQDQATMLQQALLWVAAAPRDPTVDEAAWCSKRAACVTDLALRWMHLCCCAGNRERVKQWSSALADLAKKAPADSEDPVPGLSPAELPDLLQKLQAAPHKNKSAVPGQMALLHSVHWHPVEACVLWLSAAHVCAYGYLPDVVVSRLGYAQQPFVVRWQADVPGATHERTRKHQAPPRWSQCLWILKQGAEAPLGSVPLPSHAKDNAAFSSTVACRYPAYLHATARWCAQCYGLSFLKLLMRHPSAKLNHTPAFCSRIFSPEAIALLGKGYEQLFHTLGKDTKARILHRSLLASTGAVRLAQSHSVQQTDPASAEEMMKHPLAAITQPTVAPQPADNSSEASTIPGHKSDLSDVFSYNRVWLLQLAGQLYQDMLSIGSVTDGGRALALPDPATWWHQLLDSLPDTPHLLQLQEHWGAVATAMLSSGQIHEAKLVLGLGASGLQLLDTKPQAGQPPSASDVRYAYSVLLDPAVRQQQYAQKRGKQYEDKLPDMFGPDWASQRCLARLNLACYEILTGNLPEATAAMDQALLEAAGRLKLRSLVWTQYLVMLAKVIMCHAAATVQHGSADQQAPTAAAHPASPGLPGAPTDPGPSASAAAAQPHANGTNSAAITMVAADAMSADDNVRHHQQDEQQQLLRILIRAMLGALQDGRTVVPVPALQLPDVSYQHAELTARLQPSGYTDVCVVLDSLQEAMALLGPNQVWLTAVCV